MNREQYYSMLSAYEMDKRNLELYRKRFKYAYLLSDGIFKIVFTEDESHEKLISLVNALLRLEGSDAIKSVTLEMQEFPGAFDQKKSILDIIGTTQAGAKVLVEIQQKGDYFFKDRIAYYLSRVIVNQVHKGQKYELPKIYFLGILDFILLPDEPTEYIHTIQETYNGKPFFPKIQKVFVELSKFFTLEKNGDTANDHSPAAEWLRAIQSIIDEKPMPERLMQNPVFLDLQNRMELSNFTDELFNLEVHHMTDLKYEHEVGFAEGRESGRVEGLTEGREVGIAEGREFGLAEGREFGIAEGREIGLTEGREVGIAEGREFGLAEGREVGRKEGYEKGVNEGSLKAKRDIVKSLLAEGISISTIAKASGLSESEIKSL